MPNKIEFPLATRNVSCSRVINGETVQVVDVTKGFEPASLNVLFGKQGCGKNLLLRLLGLMEKPDAGEIVVEGTSTRDWTPTECADARSRNFGFIFEAPFLLPSFNVVENIAMPLFKLTTVPPDEARTHTDRVLDFVGLSHCSDFPVYDLPHWAALRISLARALVIDPVALFVENIDGGLRDDELIAFIELLSAAKRAFGCCILVTATSRDVASFGNRALELVEGRIVRDWNPGELLS